tara:strand:+ start:2614 stop:3441 length:828 start_codon:yes stop_codon:yes gene_type:complete
MKTEITENNFALIRCNQCHSSNWRKEDKNLNCCDCDNSYAFNENNQLISLKDHIDDENWEKVTTSFNLFKDDPKPIKKDKLGGPRISELKEKFKIKGVAINLGSGQDNYDGFLNIDLGSYKPVDIVADLKNIPIIENSVDLVASNSVLEHIYDFQKVIEEVFRILKPKGYFYLCVPSACLRHHEFDYHRWTTPGLHKLMENRFDVIDSGSARGVGYALITFGDALISYKIQSILVKKLLSSFWRFFSKPLLWIKDDPTEEYQAMSETIYVIGRKI